MAQVTKVMVGEDGLAWHAKIATISVDGKRIKISRSIESTTPLEMELGFIEGEFTVETERFSHICKYKEKGRTVKNNDPSICR
jgi:hypothetical protein